VKNRGFGIVFCGFHLWWWWRSGGNAGRGGGLWLRTVRKITRMLCIHCRPCCVLYFISMYSVFIPGTLLYSSNILE